MSKDEIKSNADKLANALGYNIHSDNLHVINVKDAYCIGFTNGNEDKDQYAKEKAIELDKWKDENGWIYSNQYYYKADKSSDFLTVEELYNLFINKTKEQ